MIPLKKLLTISKDPSIKVSSRIQSYLFPEYIYINVNKDTNFMFKKRKIKKGEKLFFQCNNVIQSPVSGIIEGIIEKKGNDSIKYYLKIKNDFAEEDSYVGVKEFTTRALKLDFASVLEEDTTFNTLRLKNKKVLILNGIEDEPYLVTKTTLHKTYPKEILSTLDLLAESFKIERIEMYFKESDRESIEAFSKEIGTYPNIKIEILPDLYPIGDNNVLSKYLRLDDDATIIQTEEILSIYEEGVRKRVKDIVFVTITGNAIKNPMVIKIKIGTPLKEVIEELIKIKKGNYQVLLNGLMKGKHIDIEEYIIDSSTKAIYFMKENNLKEEKCITCGKCIEVCPLNCNPYRSYLTKGKYQSKNCISCGLCSFICPSHINLIKYVKGE